MYDSSDSDSSDITERKAFGLGLLVGALMGAGAALLLAPASGEQTRRSLRRGAQRVYSHGGGMLSDAWEDADRYTRPMRKSASRKLGKGMKRSRRYMEDAAELVESGRRRFGW